MEIPLESKLGMSLEELSSSKKTKGKEGKPSFAYDKKGKEL
jgi:hypothetical protein